jgi:LAO/AO transport system kinase
LTKTEEIVKGIFAGNRRSIAKAITIIENGEETKSRELIAEIYPHTGKAHIIGITGAGGAGKSTLIEKIVKEYRRENKTVGVVAVDPTSPFTGGALLGDRIRMQELCTDRDVFIRSMATRNYAGGIAKATKDAVKILDAAGKDVVIVETVGAGQAEVDIIKVAQTIIMVHAPGLGDDIQAIKAGIMEIADIFVVNKADREGADKAVIDIQSNLQLNSKGKPWKPPVLKTIALTGEGVPELIEKIEKHRCFLEENQECKRASMRMRAESELAEAIREMITNSLIEELKRDGELDRLIHEIMERKTDPASVARRLLRKVLKNET